MKNQNVIIGCVVSVVLAGGVGFFGGMQYQKTKITSLRGQGGFGQAQNGAARNGGTTRTGQGANQANPSGMVRGGAIVGDVSAKDDKSITVKMADGSSKIVVLSDTTTYRISEDSSLDKIAVGTKISAFGTSNSDGSTTASSIQINPVMPSSVPMGK